MCGGLRDAFRRRSERPGRGAGAGASAYHLGFRQPDPAPHHDLRRHYPVLDHDKLVTFIERKWNDEILHALTDYIAIPRRPAFDPDWAKRGYLERVVTDAAQWAERQPVKGLKLEIVRLPGRTPVIFFESPATRSGSTDTILLYGHLDKQPEFDGWRADLGPWTPKYENGKLYGRGGADDGYAIYASLAALGALDEQGIERRAASA